jgi:hypothetical protein
VGGRFMLLQSTARVVRVRAHFTFEFCHWVSRASSEAQRGAHRGGCPRQGYRRGQQKSASHESIPSGTLGDSRLPSSRSLQVSNYACVHITLAYYVRSCAPTSRDPSTGPLCDRLYRKIPRHRPTSHTSKMLRCQPPYRTNNSPRTSSWKPVMWASRAYLVLYAASQPSRSQVKAVFQRAAREVSL